MNGVIGHKLNERFITVKLTEVRMVHCLSGSESLLVIVPKKLVEEVESFLTHQVLVVVVDKTLQPLLRMPTTTNVKVIVQQTHIVDIQAQTTGSVS